MTRISSSLLTNSFAYLGAIFVFCASRPEGNPARVLARCALLFLVRRRATGGGSCVAFPRKIAARVVWVARGVLCQLSREVSCAGRS